MVFVQSCSENSMCKTVVGHGSLKHRNQSMGQSLNWNRSIWFGLMFRVRSCALSWYILVLVAGTR